MEQSDQTSPHSVYESIDLLLETDVEEDLAGAGVTPGSAPAIRVPPRHAGLVSQSGTGPTMPFLDAPGISDEETAGSTESRTRDSVVDAAGSGSTAGGDRLRLRDVLLDHATQELLGPLGSIISGIEFLGGGESPALEPEQRQVLEQMEERAIYLRRLFENLCIVSDPARAFVQESKRPIDLGSILDRTVRATASIARLQSIEPELQLSEDLPLIEADPGRVQHLMVNLTDYAIRFAPTGGHVRLGAESVPEGVHAWVEVECPVSSGDCSESSGPSAWITADERDLEPRDQSVGARFNLTVAREIVEHLGGRLTIELSPPDAPTSQGCRFGILFPCAAPTSPRSET